MPTSPAFDAYAARYDAALNRGLRFTGEGKEYFAEARVRWTRRVLGAAHVSGWRSLDFGCGTGTATPFLQQILEADKITGADPSNESRELAAEKFGGLGAEFCHPNDLSGNPGAFDFAYCNGVFHHIPPAERAAAAASIFKALKPGGWFAFWENNGWNPITRMLMRLVPFDRDAILLWPHESRRMLRAAGFSIQRTDYLFIFPGSLKFLRPIEDRVSKLPLGAQYLVLARKCA